MAKSCKGHARTSGSAWCKTPAGPVRRLPRTTHGVKYGLASLIGYLVARGNLTSTKIWPKVWLIPFGNPVTLPSATIGTKARSDQLRPQSALILNCKISHSKQKANSSPVVIKTVGSALRTSFSGLTEDEEVPRLCLQGTTHRTRSQSSEL